MKHLPILIVCAAAIFWTGCRSVIRNLQSKDAHVPEWVSDAVFYQIFPERFRNGDPKNNPTRESLELHANAPTSWEVSDWTGDWYARAAWEEAMGDSFYDTPYRRRYGGDLQGVIDKLDYLSDLGINAIYFNPVFYARSMHKYDGSNFHHIDPYFGPDPEGDLALMDEETDDPATWHFTGADRLFSAMLDEAHARGIRVIIDGVWNHTGRDFFAFADLRENQHNSPYKDWYIVNQFDDPNTVEDEFEYRGWFDIQALPAFADTPDGKDLHPGPKEYIFNVTRRWMDPDGDGDPSDGTDGWRLDVASEVPIGFWKDWNAHVRTLNPEAYTVTEIWEDAATFVEEGGFSATMNYYGFAFPVKGFLIDHYIKPAAFVEMLDERRKGYATPVQYVLQNLIDSHDTDRLASMIVNAGKQPYEREDRFDYDWGSRVTPGQNDRYDVRKPDANERKVQRLVALFQMTYPGAPMIYYGTEAGMWGADDPDDRMPMVWPDLAYEPQTHDPLGRPRLRDDVAFDSSLYNFYQRIIDLRKTHPALRRGTFEVFLADDERSVLAFQRILGDEVLVIVLNRSEEAHSLRLSRMRRGSYERVFYTEEGGHRFQQEGDTWLLDAPALSGMVFRCIDS